MGRTGVFICLSHDHIPSKDDTKTSISSNVQFKRIMRVYWKINECYLKHTTNINIQTCSTGWSSKEMHSARASDLQCSWVTVRPEALGSLSLQDCLGVEPSRYTRVADRFCEVPIAACYSHDWCFLRFWIKLLLLKLVDFVPPLHTFAEHISTFWRPDVLFVKVICPIK